MKKNDVWQGREMGLTCRVTPFRALCTFASPLEPCPGTPDPQITIWPAISHITIDISHHYLASYISSQSISHITIWPGTEARATT
eukprot:443221-Rhodomonas_salina.3